MAPAPDALAEAHLRLARRALAVQIGAAAVAVGLLVAALFNDRAHDEDQARERLLLTTELRAHHLARHLGLLSSELRRLGLRSEVDLLDRDLAPEQSLLRLAHDKSTFFNVGVAILGPDGSVAWAEPRRFLAPDASFAAAPWFVASRRDRGVRVVAVDSQRREDALLYVVSPMVRGGQFAGALLGAVDLAREGPLEPHRGEPAVVLAAPDGDVVYPPAPPAFSSESAWRRLVSATSSPRTDEAVLDGKPMVVAAAPVADSEFILLSLVPRAELFAAGLARLRTRLALALALAIFPLAVLVALWRRSLRLFRASEEEAVRAEELRLVGEAANAIAHEVKNSLNALAMGLDLALRDRAVEGARDRAVARVREEIARLSSFTGDLMSFSKGIVPRPVALDLAEFARKVVGLVRETGGEAQASLEVVAAAPVPVRADPGLVHSVLANLVGNALEAGARRVEVRVEAAAPWAGMRVSDDGPGVSAGILPRLFAPFATDKPSGVGIGLSLSRRIARAHGGDLVLEHRAPGAVFLLTLPLEPT